MRAWVCIHVYLLTSMRHMFREFLPCTAITAERAPQPRRSEDNPWIWTARSTTSSRRTAAAAAAPGAKWARLVAIVPHPTSQAARRATTAERLATWPARARSRTSATLAARPPTRCVSLRLTPAKTAPAAPESVCAHHQASTPIATSRPASTLATTALSSPPSTPHPHRRNTGGRLPAP